MALEVFQSSQLPTSLLGKNLVLGYFDLVFCFLWLNEFCLSFLIKHIINISFLLKHIINTYILHTIKTLYSP